MNTSDLHTPAMELPLDTVVEAAELDATAQEAMDDVATLRQLIPPITSLQPIDKLEFALIAQGLAQWMPLKDLRVLILTGQAIEELAAVFHRLSPCGDSFTERVLEMPDAQRWEWIKARMTPVMVEEALEPIAVEHIPPQELPLEQDQVQALRERLTLLAQLETMLKAHNRWEDDGPDSGIIAYFITAASRNLGDEAAVIAGLGEDVWGSLKRMIPTAAIRSLMQRLEEAA